ncbi:MAG: capsid protein [Oscillospiraceae bacterium]
MNMMEQVREKMRSFLRIEEAQPMQLSLRESLDYSANAIKNRVWYRGDSKELIQLYESIGDGNARFLFWASKCSPGMELRKIHTGLPAMIADTLAGIAAENFDGLTFADAEHGAVWARIERENGFRDLLLRAVTETLYIGDGAFKLSLDRAVSELPIVEFWPGDRVDYTVKRGRITEVVFRTPLCARDRRPCELREIYGPGYIRYRLVRDGEPLDMDAAEGLGDLQDVEFGTPGQEYMLAVPLRFFPSDRWEGRGRSIFDRKCECFDAFDEAWSQWMDALRAGRARIYIPENLIPRDARTGALKRPNAFDDRFIRTEADMSQGAENRVTVEQADIPHEAFAATYTAALEACLQGVISPATLGVDLKKTDNAEAQREKEKITLYTRSRMIEPLAECLAALASAAVRAAFEARSEEVPEVCAEAVFGDYASPDFDSRVETVALAVEKGVMSIETALGELYGDTRSGDWIAGEARRLRG